MPGHFAEISPTIRVQIKHVIWRNKTAHYRRRIPSEIQKHYKSMEHYAVSLGTKDPLEAARRANERTSQLDREWLRLRASNGTELETREEALGILRKYDLEPGQAAEYQKHDLEPDDFINQLRYLSSDSGDVQPEDIVRDRLPEPYRMAADLFYADKAKVGEVLVPSFLEVVDKHIYFVPKKAEDKQFSRSVDLFVEVNGDMPVHEYRRSNGNEFVRHLIEKGCKPATIKRYLNQIRPVFNTAIQELEVDMVNPLSKVRIPAQEVFEEDVRQPFSLDQVRAIQARCREWDDQYRWILSLLSDTGARASEIAGLEVDHVFLDGPVPYIDIRPTKTRGLKNKASRRKVPLVGEALWAAQRAVESAEGAYLFPRAVNGGKLNPGALSAALNKWLKEQKLRGKKQPVHSLRHTLRDRLRNTGAHEAECDLIGGWTLAGVGANYGEGHELKVLHQRLLDMLKKEGTGEK